VKQKSTVIKVLGLLALVLLGVAAGFFVGKMGANAPTHPMPLGIMLLTIALITPAFLVVVAWHEGGHAVAGVSVGFDFKMYVIGPFLWEKQSTGWRFKWNKNVNTSGGLVLCLPTDTVNLNNRFTVFAAGGPLASLFLAALSYATYAVFFKHTLTTNGGFQLLGHFFFIVALLSLLIFFATAVPMRVGGFYTDGARVLRLQRGGDAAQFENLLLKLTANTLSGVRPKSLNINELEEALAIAKRLDEPFGVYMHGFLHQAAFDNNEIEKAEKHLLEYVNEADNFPEGVRNAVWLDAAFFYAYAKRDLEKAETFWQQFKPAAMIPQAQVFATEAALSFLKKDKETALSKIENALKELPNMIDQGVATALKDKLMLLKSSIASDSHSWD
jgi:hypothetical protein